MRRDDEFSSTLDHRHSGDRGDGIGMRADLHVAVEGLRRVDRGEPCPGELELPAISAMSRASFGPTTTVLSIGPHLEHEAGLAVVGREADVEALALADGEGVRALVLTDHGARAVEDLALLGADAVGEPAAGVAVGDEADVVAVGLLRDA